MNYLGVDFGSKRIGLAVSDASGSFAMPLKVLENSEATVFEIWKICAERKIGMVVVGESRNFKMEENEIMKEAKIFVESLKEKAGLSVVTHPEFLTSAEAEKIQGKNDMLDASAAAIILKSYLDSNKKG